MSNHKDLPPSSQKWAGEVDAMLKELVALREVVRRLTENAGIDMANPKRGVNTGNTPSVKSPVGQKLSSLADVSTYNVLDGQMLSWYQQGQKWMPVTLPEAGEAINWRLATENEHLWGDLSIDGDYYSNRVFGQEYAGNYGSASDSKGLVGTSTASAYLTASQKNFGGPTTSHSWVAVHPYYVMIGSAWVADDGSTYQNSGGIEVGRDIIYLRTPKGLYGGEGDGRIELDTNWFFVPKRTTANRPVVPVPFDPLSFKGAMIFDTTLGIPIWWNGTTWTNALGTAV